MSCGGEGISEAKSAGRGISRSGVSGVESGMVAGGEITNSGVSARVGVANGRTWESMVSLEGAPLVGPLA